MEWISKIPLWVRIPLKILLPSLWIFSGFLLLIDDNVATKLYLLDFRKNSGFIFGIIFLICTALILCYIALYIIEYIKRKIENKKIKQVFGKLDNVYKQYLYDIYRTPSKTIRAQFGNATVVYLTAIQALGHGSTSVGRDVFDYFLQPWVINAINDEIAFAKNYIRKYKKNYKHLQKRKNFKDIKQNYENAIEFLKYMTESNTTDEEDW